MGLCSNQKKKKKRDYVCCVLLGTLLLVTLVESYFEPERYIQYLELNGYRRTIVLNTTHATTKNPEIDIAARLFHL